MPLCASFAEKGFQNATITEISKEAGVSEATIYEYFGTKEDLLFAIPEKISNETFEKSSKVIPYIKGVEGKIRAIIAFLCTALSIQSPLFRSGSAAAHVQQAISPDARACRDTPVVS
ncbi:MAG: TetR/AcrR family transcriptional regulator [Desulfobacterales bacterium]|nr:TetR/AcrR family transcriptional regulator [Desulfobacterales bacterium]